MFTAYLGCITIAVLLASTAQAHPQLSNSVTEEFQEWAREKLLTAIDQLQEAGKHLKNTVRKVIDDGYGELQLEYANQMLEYNSRREEFHPQCFQEGLAKLTEYKLPEKPDVESLLADKDRYIVETDEKDVSTTPQPNCVLLAIEDAGSMLFLVIKYIVSILSTLDDIRNGYYNCADTLWRKFSCLFTYSTTAIMDIYHAIAGVTDLISNLMRLSKDIKLQISQCLHLKQMEIKQQMMLAMNHAQTCTKGKLL